MNETAVAEPRRRRLRSLAKRELEVVRDPYGVGRAPRLLEEGRRREALAALEQGRARALSFAPEEREYTGSTERDLELAAFTMEGLEQIGLVARELARAGGWGRWEERVDLEFERLAIACVEEAEEIHRRVLASSGAKRERAHRRRFVKALALSLSTPLWVFVSLFGADELAADRSTTAWALSLVVVPVLAGMAAAGVTFRLWRRGSTSKLLYAPFATGLLIAEGVLAALLS